MTVRDRSGSRIRESAILRQIGDYLTAKQVFWFRLNTGAFRLEDRYFRAHSLGPGAADILALRFGKAPLWIECKAKGGRLSKAQNEFRQMVEDWKHHYVVVYSIDDLQDLI